MSHAPSCGHFRLTVSEDLIAEHRHKGRSKNVPLGRNCQAKISPCGGCLLELMAVVGAEDVLGVGRITDGNSGTGKTHVALGLGLAACQRGAVGWLHHRRIPRP